MVLPRPTPIRWRMGSWSCTTHTRAHILQKNTRRGRRHEDNWGYTYPWCAMQGTLTVDQLWTVEAQEYHHFQSSCEHRGF